MTLKIIFSTHFLPLSTLTSLFLLSPTVCVFFSYLSTFQLCVFFQSIPPLPSLFFFLLILSLSFSSIYPLTISSLFTLSLFLLYLSTLSFASICPFSAIFSSSLSFFLISFKVIKYGKNQNPPLPSNRTLSLKSRMSKQMSFNGILVPTRPT